MRTTSTGNFDSPDVPDAGRADTDANPPTTSVQTRQDVDEQRSPRTPTDRDESPDSDPGQPRDVMDKAHDDAARGRPPTDRGEASDAAYANNLRGRTPGAERDEGGGPGKR